MQVVSTGFRMRLLVGAGRRFNMPLIWLMDAGWGVPLHIDINISIPYIVFLLIGISPTHAIVLVLPGNGILSWLMLI